MPFTQTDEGMFSTVVFTCTNPHDKESYRVAVSIDAIKPGGITLDNLLRKPSSEVTCLQKIKLLVYVFEVIKQCTKQRFSSLAPSISRYVYLRPHAIELEANLFSIVSTKKNSEVKTQLANEINTVFKKLCIEAAKDVFSNKDIEKIETIKEEIKAANSRQQNPARPSQTATACCSCFTGISRLFRRNTDTLLSSAPPTSNTSYQTCTPRLRPYPEDVSALEKAIKIIDSIIAERRRQQRQHKQRRLSAPTPPTFSSGREFTAEIDFTPMPLGTTRFENWRNQDYHRPVSAPLLNPKYGHNKLSQQRSNTSSPRLPKFRSNSAPRADKSAAGPATNHEQLNPHQEKPLRL